jgi:hypothetical protein
MHELENFILAMKDEAALLITFAGMEEEMQRLVGERHWDSLESNILRLRKKTDAIDKAEEERVHSFQMLKVVVGIPEDASFFKLLPFIPEEKRRNMTEAYRNLKLAVYAVKGATLRLSYYFQSYSETVKKVMGEIFPHRKGKMYSQNGRPTKTIDERLVLDKQL